MGTLGNKIYNFIKEKTGWGEYSETKTDPETGKKYIVNKFGPKGGKKKKKKTGQVLGK